MSAFKFHVHISILQVPGNTRNISEEREHRSHPGAIQDGTARRAFPAAGAQFLFIYIRLMPCCVNLLYNLTQSHTNNLVASLYRGIRYMNIAFGAPSSSVRQKRVLLGKTRQNEHLKTDSRPRPRRGHPVLLLLGTDRSFYPY